MVAVALAIAGLGLARDLRAQDRADAGADAGPQVACPDPKALVAPLESEVKRLGEIIEQKDSVIKSLQSDNANKDQKLADLQKELDASKSKNDELLKRFVAIDQERARLSTQLVQQRVGADATRAQLNAVRDRLVTATSISAKDRAELQQQQTSLEHALEEKNEALAQTESKLKESTEAKEKLKDELDAAAEAQTKAEAAVKDKQLALNKDEEQLAAHSAWFAIVTISVIVLIPVVVLGIFIGTFRSEERRAERAAVLAKYLDVALSLRRERDGDDAELRDTERDLVEELVTTRALVTRLREALGMGIALSLILAFALAVVALFFLRTASLGEEHVELIKSAAWQALIGLFTPVASLLAMVTLAQTKYKDAMTHCLSAELVHKPTPRR